MEQSANVTSIDGIRELRSALLKFEDTASDGLTMLTLEVRRAMQWLEVDQRRYWPEQVRRASQQLVEKRNDLERCQLKYGSEEAPSCYEQKVAFEHAKRRLRYCENQVKVVKHWIQTVRQELNDFEGQVAKLTSVLDADIPQAVTTLERMLRALDNYVGGGKVDGVDVGSRRDPGATSDAKPPPSRVAETNDPGDASRTGDDRTTGDDQRANPT